MNNGIEPSLSVQKIQRMSCEKPWGLYNQCAIEMNYTFTSHFLKPFEAYLNVHREFSCVGTLFLWFNIIILLGWRLFNETVDRIDRCRTLLSYKHLFSIGSVGPFHSFLGMPLYFSRIFGFSRIHVYLCVSDLWGLSLVIFILTSCMSSILPLVISSGTKNRLQVSPVEMKLFSHDRMSYAL